MKRKLCLFLSIFLVCTSIASSICLSGCGKKNVEEECPYADFIVVDVFDSFANFEGIQSGWFAKIVKDKFNMELNVIAPNVSGGGDTLFEIRSAAGNIGDLILCSGQNGTLQNMVTAGLVLDMTPYLTDKDILNYDLAISTINNGLSPEGIYAIPSEVSLKAPDVPSESTELTYGPYLRWDIYKSIGYPEMTTLEDLLPVLQEMQEKYSYTEDGTKTYGFSFFSDWDDNMMNAAKQPCCFYGYDELGFVLAKADGSDYQDILDDNSLYQRVLKLYFEANQLGLVDPDSRTQDYQTVCDKYRNGSILYTPWPWQGQSYFNSSENTSLGKGYMLSDIEDMQIFSYGSIPEGNQRYLIAVGSNAQDPQRLVDFIDWLYSPEGIAINGAQYNNGTAGIRGLTWEMDEEGPYLTDFGKDALQNNDVQMPEEYGGGTWEEGSSVLNFKTVAVGESDPSGYPYSYEEWDSYIEQNDNPLLEDWKLVMNADSTRDYLDKNNKIIVAPGSSYICPVSTNEESTIRRQCKNTIIKYSWDMVFAKDEDEFYRLQNELKDTVNGLGYQTIITLDMQYAKDQNDARVAAVENYYKNHTE